MRKRVEKRARGRRKTSELFHTPPWPLKRRISSENPRYRSEKLMPEELEAGAINMRLRNLSSIPRARRMKVVPRLVKTRFIQRDHARDGVGPHAREHLGARSQSFEGGIVGNQIANPGLVGAAANQKPLAVRAVTDPSVPLISGIEDRCAERLAAARAPEPDRASPGQGCEPVAIRRKDGQPGFVVMRQPGRDRFTGSRVPNPRG